MNKLILAMSPIEVHDRDLTPCSGECFANITLMLESDLGVACSFFRKKWDASQFFDWAENNKKAICEDEFLGEYKQSLAVSICAMQEKDLTPDENDALFEYRRVHDLRFALRGLDVPSIIIGIGEGGGELSLLSDDFCMNFQVDLCRFFQAISTKHSELVSRSSDGYLNEVVIIG